MPSQDLEISQFSETIDYNEHNAGTKSIKMKTFPHVQREKSPTDPTVEAGDFAGYINPSSQHKGLYFILN